VTDLYIAVATIGGLVLLIGLFSNFLKSRTFLTPPLLSLVAGVALGPAALGALDPARWGAVDRLLEEGARLSLAIGLMALALRLPPGYVLQHRRTLAVMLGLVLPLAWLATAVLVQLVLAVPFALALLVGAVVTPTDPIAATSIVTGPAAERRIPERIRHLISAEAGLNDGVGYAVIVLSLTVLTAPPAETLPRWLAHTVLWEVGGGAAFGALLGLVAGRLLRFSERRRLIEKTSFLAYSVALSLLVLGAAELIGTEGILAVFVAGLAFDGVVSARDRVREENVQEAVEQFFTLPIFALLGLVLPWSRWAELGWQAPALVLAVLLLRRLPAVLAVGFLLPELRAARNVLFVGWFGPLGASAVLFAMFALHRTGDEQLWTVASLLIATSVVAHGITATPMTVLYRNAGRRADDAGRQ
jgi:sodium/hydrogen antiporter